VFEGLMTDRRSREKLSSTRSGILNVRTLRRKLVDKVTVAAAGGAVKRFIYTKDR